jgi:CDP-diacylglycerol--serine O-phosphatidyltransferase
VHRFLDLPNLVTLLGLWLGLTCGLLASQGRLAPAFAALVVAGVCDLLDGLVARRLGAGRGEEARRFGARLDSLVDACSFGAAPALVLQAAWPGGPGALLGGLLLSCAVWRLAYFDTVGLSSEGEARYYTGLPTTWVALLFPLAGLAGFAGPDPLRWTLGAVAVAHAGLMVAPVRVRKPGGLWYAILLLLAAGLLGVYGWSTWQGEFPWRPIPN